MKVRVTFTVDIDLDAWEENYGVSASDKAALRQDVQTYVRNGALDQLALVGVLVPGQWG